MAQGTRRTGDSTPKAVAIYLTRLRPLLVEATSTRHGFVREIGVLMENARHQNPTVVAQAAGKLGRSQMALFRDVRLQVNALQPPSSCQPCQHSVTTWLDKQIGACEVMVDVSVHSDMTRLREVQGLLAEGRLHARRFNGEYGRLVEALRAAVGAAVGRGSGRPLARSTSRPTVRAR